MRFRRKPGFSGRFYSNPIHTILTHPASFPHVRKQLTVIANGTPISSVRAYRFPMVVPVVSIMFERPAAVRDDETLAATCNVRDRL